MHHGGLLIFLVVGLGAPAMAAPENVTEEVPVAFDGDEEVILEEGGTLEEEVFFEEEVDLDALDAAPVFPEYEYDRRLLALPAALLLLLVWNVRWRRVRRHPRPRRGDRRRKLKGRRRTAQQERILV